MELLHEVRMFFLGALVVMVSVILPLASMAALFLERRPPAERAGRAATVPGGGEQRRLVREVGLRQARWRLFC